MIRANGKVLDEQTARNMPNGYRFSAVRSAILVRERLPPPDLHDDRGQHACVGMEGLPLTCGQGCVEFRFRKQGSAPVYAAATRWQTEEASAYRGADSVRR
jgi:hypothetical protein